MAERFLSMEEVMGSIPMSSNFFYFFYFFNFFIFRERRKYVETALKMRRRSESSLSLLSS